MIVGLACFATLHWLCALRWWTGGDAAGRKPHEAIWWLPVGWYAGEVVRTAQVEEQRVRLEDLTISAAGDGDLKEGQLGWRWRPEAAAAVGEEE
jgi:hypothetical protein